MDIREQVKELRLAEEIHKHGKLYSCPCIEKLICKAADTIESLSAKLADMERQAEDCSGGWIPCKEKLPEESGYYLCTIFCKDGRVLVKTIYFNHLHIWIEDCTDVIYPDAWQPLPEPYHEP